MVDGARVLLTPFRMAVIPPPMSSFVAVLPATPLALAFAPPGTARFIAVATGSLDLLVWGLVDQNPKVFFRFWGVQKLYGFSPPPLFPCGKKKKKKKKKVAGVGCR